MSEVHPAPYSTEIAYPTCAKCHASMVLKRLSAGKFNSYIGKFECNTCGRTMTETIKLRSISSPPLTAPAV
jgi:hypothetical protein